MRIVSLCGLGIAMRVLQVVYQLGYGGIESLLMNIYRRMDLSKIQFDFLCHTLPGYGGNLSGYGGVWEDEIRQMGGRVFHAPAPRDGLHNYIEFVNEILESNQDCRIVHGHNLDPCAFIYMHCAKQANRYVIAHSHNTGEQDVGSLRYLQRRFWRTSSRCIPDYFFGCSYEAGEYAFGRRIANSDKFQILNNGIDLSLYESITQSTHEIAKEKLFPDCRGPLLFNDGRCVHQKNQMFLIDIFDEVLKVNPDAWLVIAGEGPLRRDLAKRADELGITSRVCLPGVVNNIPEYLTASDIFVFPSLFEGLGISALEAQAAGLPTLISSEIPSLVSCTSLATRLSLQESPEVWAKASLRAYELNRGQRKSAVDQVRLAGFDIDSVAAWLQSFYLACSD